MTKEIRYPCDEIAGFEHVLIDGETYCVPKGMSVDDPNLVRRDGKPREHTA